MPVTSLETFSWLDGGYFLVQTYETIFGDEPAQKGVNYWMYDSERKGFGIVFFSNNGPYSDAGNRYYGEVANEKLSMVAQLASSTSWTQEGKIKTNPDGSISVAWWLRDEDGGWQPWMTNTFVRADTDSSANRSSGR